MKIYKKIASKFVAIGYCKKHNNQKLLEEHTDFIKNVVKEHFPSGSGFDWGTEFDFERSQPNKLIFFTMFHHSKEGMYTCRTEHDVVITPNLVFDFDIKVKGLNKNDIKDHIAEKFSYVLDKEI